MLDNDMRQNRSSSLAVAGIAFSLAATACVDLGLRKDVTLDDFPGDYVASRFGEKRILSIKEDGAYLLRRSKNGSRDSFLGFWKGRDDGDSLFVQLEGAEDPRANPFDWGDGSPDPNSLIYNQLDRLIGGQGGFPSGSVHRSAIVEKLLTGRVVISESFDDVMMYKKYSP